MRWEGWDQDWDAGVEEQWNRACSLARSVAEDTGQQIEAVLLQRLLVDRAGRGLETRDLRDREISCRGLPLVMVLCGGSPFILVDFLHLAVPRPGQQPTSVW